MILLTRMTAGHLTAFLRWEVVFISTATAVHKGFTNTSGAVEIPSDHVVLAVSWDWWFHALCAVERWDGCLCWKRFFD